MNQRAVSSPKLFRAPLVFVLAQVKITPVMGFESKIPMIQEALRKQGFPRLHERRVERQQTGGLPTPPGTIDESRHQWEFIDKEKKASVLVDRESLNYQVTRYDVFATFIESMKSILRVFADCVDPALVSRVGLRYVNLVVPDEGKQIQSYFSSRLRGFEIRDSDERKAFFSESVFQTKPECTFVHRYVEANSGFGFPPDLLPLELEMERELRMKSPFGLLDLDHFSTREFDFSTDVILDQFSSLHEHQTRAFEASVTAEAFEEWRQQ